MPGLYDSATWVQLPLEASYVNACANGFILGLSAQLTYRNTGSGTAQAMFIYFLEEGEVVTSFEAVTGNRRVQAQIQSQIKMEECCTSCQWDTLPCYCPRGHVVLDPDTAHNVFALSVGAVHPSTVVLVTLKSSRELKTLPGGAVHVTLNSTLTPLALSPGEPSETGDSLCEDRLCSCSASCFGGVSGSGGNPWLLPPDSRSQLLPSMHPGSLAGALGGLAINPHCYQFTFRLQVYGPCLLAGIESPSHALRADASPFALSASSTWISLAEEFKCDRALEIILHPSEPHLPHLCLEKGSKSFSQYEAHIKDRKDFIRGIKKSSDPERQANFVRKRFHKDLQFNPVLMLNFCPDVAALSTLSSDLPTVTREVIFISHLMEDPSHNFRDALLLAVRSLPLRTLLNIACGMCESGALFPASRQCSTKTLELACDFIQSNGLFGKSSNLLSLLGRTLALPVHRGYPRQFFIFTDTDILNGAKILELIRRYEKTVRVFGFGLGSSAFPTFLEKAATLTKGEMKVVIEGERLQPKLIKSLKKALEPALSDITIDWYMPETMEAVLTPYEIAPLYPGDSLIGYCTLYNLAGFRSKKGMTRGTRGGSLSSVFQSHEESQASGATDTSCLNQSGVEDVERALHEISHEISMEFSTWNEDPERSESTCGDGTQISDIRRRIERSTYVQDQYVLTHCSISTDPTCAPTQPSMCSDRTRAPSHGSTSSESVGSIGTVPGDCVTPCSRKISQQGQKAVSQNECVFGLNRNSTPYCKASVVQSSEDLIKRKALIQATMSGRSFSSPHGELDMLRLRNVLEKVSQSREPEEDGHPKRSEVLADSCHLLSPAQLDWDMLVDAQYFFTALPAADGTNLVSVSSGGSVWQCRAVIHGYIGGRSHSWETSVSLEPLLRAAEEDDRDCIENEKCCDLHHLAARSVIQDNEDMAWRDCGIEHGSSRRFRLKAMQTSKSCSQASSFTCHVPVDASTQEELLGPKIMYTGDHSRRSCSSNVTNWSMGDLKGSENMDDLFANGGRAAISQLSPLILPFESVLEKMGSHEGHITSSCGSQRASDASLSSRISVGKKKIRSMSGKLSPLKPCLTGDKEACTEPVEQDYLPLINLQFAEGFFSLNSSFSDVVQISLQRLLRTSPFSSHRGSLSPVSEPCPSEMGDFPKGGVQTFKGGSHSQVPLTHDNSFHPVCATSCPEALCHQADSGRGSETDPCDTSPCPSEAGTELDSDLEGRSWATAVALAWLEHRCAGFFTEWELLAAKAEGWLRAQTFPDGLQLPALKGAARQLFLLLRHWDENLNLNMLCYKPGNV
ncbi:von Willebrand factor A domain-containing protein 5B2 [Gastrophryne carolinensis]